MRVKFFCQELNGPHNTPYRNWLLMKLAKIEDILVIDLIKSLYGCKIQKYIVFEVMKVKGG